MSSHTQEEANPYDDLILSMEVQINQNDLLGDESYDNNWSLLLTEDWQSLSKEERERPFSPMFDTSARSNITTVTPDKEDHFLDPELQLEYRRTIKRFTKSMRRSDQTRSIVKRIRLSLQKKNQGSRFLTRNEFEDIRGKVYQMLVSSTNVPV